MNHKRLFLNWLQQYHIKNKFLHNCRTVRNTIHDRHDPPIKYIWKEEPYLYIINSFSWGDSSEGFRFWENYDFLWQDFLSQYISNHIK
jgi:hypothetical protein